MYSVYGPTWARLAKTSGRKIFEWNVSFPTGHSRSRPAANPHADVATPLFSDLWRRARCRGSKFSPCRGFLSSPKISPTSLRIARSCLQRSRRDAAEEEAASPCQTAVAAGSAAAGVSSRGRAVGGAAGVGQPPRKYGTPNPSLPPLSTLGECTKFWSLIDASCKHIIWPCFL